MTQKPKCHEDTSYETCDIISKTSYYLIDYNNKVFAFKDTDCYDGMSEGPASTTILSEQLYHEHKKESPKYIVRVYYYRRKKFSQGNNLQDGEI